MRHVTRLRLLRQGFTGLSEAQLEDVGPWLRLAPAACAVVGLTGAALESWLLLWVLSWAGAIAAATQKHPFDLFYDLMIRRWLGREERLPDYGPPRRFASGMASAGFFFAGLALVLGAREVGVLTGLFFTGAVALAPLTDICLGCNMYHMLVPERVQRRALTSASVTTMLNRRRSTTAPREALRKRPQLRRTG